MLLKKKKSIITYYSQTLFFLCGMCILQLPYSHSVFPQATVAQQPAVESLDFFSFLDFLSTRVLLAVNYNLAQVQVSDDIIVVGS